MVKLGLELHPEVMERSFGHRLGSSLAWVLALSQGACFDPSLPSPERPSLVDEETDGESSGGMDETGDLGGEPAPECSLGAPGCACTAGGGCDAGLVCGGGFCMPLGCTPGTLNCSCDEGTCAADLVCNTGDSGDVCAEPVDGADSGGTTGEDGCEPQGADDDCNGNGVRDTCDPKEGSGTCTLWGVAEDADEVPGQYLNGDIRRAFVENRSGQLILGMAFHEPLDFSDAGAVFEFWWFFDVDNDASTGSEQVHMFGGDAYVRVDVDANGSALVKVGDGDQIGSGIVEPGADVDLEDDDRLLVVSLDMPGELVGLADSTWVGVSGGHGGNFQPDTDKTSITLYRSVPAIDEDCDGNGLFDSCEEVVDQIGWGPGVGDGVPDSCQVDEDNDGVDDACQ